MTYQFKDLKSALKELAPTFMNPNFIYQGREFTDPQTGEKFMMRPREAMVNWLAAASLDFLFKLKNPSEEDIFTVRESDGDGHIVNRLDGSYYDTEHVFVYEHGKDPVSLKQDFDKDNTQIIIDTITKKISKGEEYGKGLNLFVFIENIGKWFPLKVVNFLKTNKYTFDSVWTFSLLTSNDKFYKYVIFQADNGQTKSSYICHNIYVEIPITFDSWRISVEQVNLLDKRTIFE